LTTILFSEGLVVSFLSQPSLKNYYTPLGIGHNIRFIILAGKDVLARQDGLFLTTVL
jgi:hypothetical protein